MPFGQITRTLPIIFLLASTYGASFATIAIRIESMEASGRLIGIAAAMPALGWLIGTALLPYTLRHFRLNHFMAFTLCMALVAWIGSAAITAPAQWVPMRLFFGGGMGLFFRAYEYWLTEASAPDKRGINFGSYAAIFVFGITAGALMQPAIGIETMGIVAVSAGIGLCAVWSAFIFAPQTAAPHNSFSMQRIRTSFNAAPLAMIAAFTYAFYEEAPASFLPIYALKLGYAETVAATILAVSVLGALAGAIPMGWLCDKWGRRAVLLLAAIAGTIGSAIIPALAHNQTLLFSAIFIWAFLAEGIFVVALALVADRFRGEDLLHANMAFGIFYALGAIVGPILCGEAMQRIGTNGLFWAVGAIFVALFVTVTTKRKPEL